MLFIFHAEEEISMQAPIFTHFNSNYANFVLVSIILNINKIT